MAYYGVEPHLETIETQAGNIKSSRRQTQWCPSYSTPTSYLLLNAILLNIHKSWEYCCLILCCYITGPLCLRCIPPPWGMKVSIVPAVTETNDYSSFVRVEYKLLLGNFFFLATLFILVPLQMSRAGFSFRVPTFPLMCVIIALTFPMGARRLVTWPAPLLSVSAEATAFIKPHSLATVRKPWLLGYLFI